MPPERCEPPDGTPAGTVCCETCAGTAWGTGGSWGRVKVADEEIHTYEITVQGFPPDRYSARTPANARAQCWRAYQSYRPECGFGEFLAISTLRRVPNPPGIGDRIMVCGAAATRVIGRHSQYVAFMRDGEGVILFSHPADVVEVERV